MKGPKGLTDEFYGFIKSRKRYIFVIDSYLNDSAFTVACVQTSPLPIFFLREGGTSVNGLVYSS